MQRFYRALLHLYPASFRQEYGEEMLRVFARGDRSTAAIVGETIVNAAAVHLDILRQDLRYATRTLMRSPGFAITAILVVALGVGANTAVFSLTDHIFLSPLPFPAPDRLVKLWQAQPGYGRMEYSPANYRDMKNAAKSFEAVGQYFSQSLNLVGDGEPVRVEAGQLSSDVMPVLGVAPAMGRWFSVEDDIDGAPHTVILSDGFWKSRYGADPGILGHKLLLNNAPYVVVGVMPASFRFPRRDIDLWVPNPLTVAAFSDRNNNYLNVIARLKPGVTLEAARAEGNVIARQLEAQYPREDEKTGVNMYLLKDDISAQSRLMLGTLAGAAACVLLIACANLANLLLARAMARRKELSVRASMGAGRERLARQMITESLIPSLLGGVLGVAIAISAAPALTRLAPTNLPISAAPPLNLRLFGMAALFTLITGMAFSVIPAWRIGSKTNFSGLREGSRSGGGQKARLRSILVVAEVVVSVVLLVSAGLLLRALWRVQSVNPGFQPSHVLTMRTVLPWPKYQNTAVADTFYRRVLGDARRIPGVTGASYISFLPMVMGGGIWPITVDGQVNVQRNANHTASSRFVLPGFFESMGIPLLRGRDIEEADDSKRPPVAVVSKSFAERYWPGQDPLGRHFSSINGDQMVVGVVGDILVRGLEQTSEPQMYFAARQMPDASFIFYQPKDFVVRSTLPPATLVPLLRDIVHAADPQQPISDVQTMEDVIDAETASRQLQVRVILLFAATAFLLAGIGIHGVLSFAVSQRTPEIGVRIALGAQRGDILGMILRQGAWLALAGLVPGVALAYWAALAMQALLAGVQPGDLTTFASAAGLAGVMTIAGCLVPALRAVRIDPLTAIRAE